MFRRILLLMMILLMLPASILAESAGSPYQVSTFAGRLPERLQEPLSALISDESRIVSGAMIQYDYPHHEPEAPASYPSCTAMLIVDTENGPLLLAAAWVKGLPWQVDDFTRLLRREENVSLSIYQPEPNRIPMFSVDYASRCGLISDLMIFRGNRLWQLTGHIDEAAGVEIIASLAHITVFENGTQHMYQYPDAFWMDYLADVTEFPTTRADAETLDKAALSFSVSNEAAGYGYTVGSNLRREATGKSESLGLYSAGIPLTLTGEEKPGTQLPWYQVRIGDTLGWMSANYVRYFPIQDYPVPLGRNVKDCPLYAAPGDAQPTAQLAPGTTFHILTEYQGMYHVCIPSGEISWDVDRQGMYGYIPKASVLTGYSPSALDTLEDAH